MTGRKRTAADYLAEAEAAKRDPSTAWVDATSAEYRVIEAKLAERAGQLRQALALWGKAAAAADARRDGDSFLRCLASIDRLKKLL